MDPLIVLFGFGVGVLVGLTGVGGGSLMTPVLILVFGFKPVTAVGTDIAYGAVTKTVGGWRHFRQHTVNLSLSTWMAFGSVPAAVAGAYGLHPLQKSTGKSFGNTVLTVVGTDVFHAAILLWAAAIAHVVAGNVDFGLAGTILIGSIPGVWLGSHWSVRLPVGTLRLVL